jgi:hypothetical protein
MTTSVENPKRIEQAWAGAKGWVTEFTGAPTSALLVNAPAENVAPGLTQLASQAQALRITIIPANKPSEAQFVELESVAAQMERLLAGELAELSANWAVQQEAFDLDLRMIVHPLGNNRKPLPGDNQPPARLVSLQLDWWSDQVFSEETDDPAQFAALATYFLELQQLFGAANLFLSAESGLDPQAQGDDWVEV